jgi:hypothetical protein
VRNLRAAAWAVFCLDLVILAQLLYQTIAANGGSGAPEAARGLALLLGSGLLGIAVLLTASTIWRSRPGLWLSLACEALPLLWVLGAIYQNLWE